MKAVEVIAPLSLHGNGGYTLALNAAQAANRPDVLELVDEKRGFYKLTGDTQFKVGEKFGIEGELPKSLVTYLDDPKLVAQRRAEAEEAKRKDAVDAEEKARLAKEAKDKKKAEAAALKKQQDDDEKKRKEAEAEAERLAEEERKRQGGNS